MAENPMNMLSGMMGGIGGGLNISKLLEDALAKQGIHVTAKIEGNKVFLTFPEEEIKKMILSRLSPQQSQMFTIEKASELVLSAKLG